MSARFTVIVAAVLALTVATPALAQKAKDTLRIALNDLVPVIDGYTLGAGEGAMFRASIYQMLIAFDERGEKFVPVLAKSFTRVNDVTIEFELRDNIKFHNGNAFDASDVKYTYDFLIDPATKVLFKGRYTFIKRVEVLGPYKVRIVMQEPSATDLGDLAYQMPVYDAETHGKLEDKGDYGRTAVGTGPYRMVYIDRNKGILTERYDGYAGDTQNFRAPIRYVHGVSIPDRQTQKAQLITGGVDVLRRITPDDAKEIASSGFDSPITPGGILMYVTLDAVGRSSNKIMMDERVRKAFIMAVDRDLIVQTLVPGGKDEKALDAICFKPHQACMPSRAPYPYDPAQAKRLLAEAGYPNGFDLTLHAYSQVKDIAEAIAGALRQVGIRASVESLPISVYVKKRSQGEFTAFVGTYPTTSQPDVANIWNFFFSGDRDYWHDDFINKVAEEGSREIDVSKRAKLYTPALDRVNELAYVMPIADLPVQWAVHRDVAILPNLLSIMDATISDFAWK